MLGRHALPESRGRLLLLQDARFHRRLIHSYILLNRTHGRSGGLLALLVKHRLLLGKGQALIPDAGGALSFRLGWIGFGAIILTNAYLIRRKFPTATRWGSLPAWLDLHIFFGLIGPTLIIFHCNFKVSGLVAISFWSMIISFLSGIIGRYFYVQVLGKRETHKRALQDYQEQFSQWVTRGLVPDDGKTLRRMTERALSVVGVDQAIAVGQASLVTVVWRSLVGDWYKYTWRMGRMSGISARLVPPLLAYAVAVRRYQTARYYRRLIGYWHAFHRPFAVFMYVVAVLHIVAALIFRTKS